MNLTYNQIIKISRAFQQAHYTLKNFGNGGEADMVLHNQLATYKYPLIWMNDAPSAYVEGLESFNFRVFFLAPAVTLKERGTDLMNTNVNEVKSDMIQCANDFITYWIQQTDNYNTLGFDKSVNRDSVDNYTDDNLREGPDHKFAMNPKSWREMVDRSYELFYSLGDGIKRVEDNEKDAAIVQRRSLRAVRDIPEGVVITDKDIESLRPMPIDALAPFEKNKLVGKIAASNIKKGEHFTLNHIS